MRAPTPTIALLSLASLVACPAQPVTPVPVPAPVDGGDPQDGGADTDGLSSPAGKACERLRAVGCPEGDPDPRTRKTCYQRLQSEAELTTIPYECVRNAKDAEAVRSCGTKATLRFRCRMADAGKDSP
jgi:hypothetical protein